MKIGITISPDIQPFVEGVGISFILLEGHDPDNPNLDSIMKELYTKYPDLSVGMNKRSRNPRIMLGKSQYTIDI